LVGSIKKPDIRLNIEQITYSQQNGTIRAAVPIENTGTGGGEGTLQIQSIATGTVIATQSFEIGPAVTTDVSENQTREISIALPEVTDSTTVLINASVRPQDPASTAIVDKATAVETTPASGPPNVTLSDLSIAGHGNTTTVTPGNYDVSVELSHDGGPTGTVPVELSIGIETANETVSLNASESTTVTFENATGGLSVGVYDVIVSAGNASITGNLTLSVPVGGGTDPATDTDGDGLLEDIDGDGAFTIFDVQAFFTNFQSGPVQDNPALFNFDESDDGSVTIFDVQALFVDLAG
jgi:hypothetical protein